MPEVFVAVLVHPVGGNVLLLVRPPVEQVKISISCFYVLTFDSKDISGVSKGRGLH